MSRALVEISGGLGNQLFQLAAACYLKDFYSRVDIDYSPNMSNRARENQIQSLASNLGVREYESFVGPLNSTALSYRLSTKLPFIRNVEVEHIDFSVPRHRVDRGFVRYRGYWQNAESAQKIQNEVKDFLKPLPTNEVALHVRKGDYLDPRHSGLHGVLPDSYFIEGIQEISKLSNERKVAIYSDSPHLVHGLTQALSRLGWSVRTEQSIKPWATLTLLAGHKYLIGSNSTYSWWAAYSGLAEKCIFPSVWFTDRKYPTELQFQRLEQIETNFL